MEDISKSKKELFTQIREGYSKLNVEKSSIKNTIYEHPDFRQYNAKLDALFDEYQEQNHPIMNGIDANTKPKAFVKTIAEDLFECFTIKPLMVRYVVYQHFFECWNETLKDDVYLLIEDGWVANVKLSLKKQKRKRG